MAEKERECIGLKQCDGAKTETGRPIGQKNRQQLDKTIGGMDAKKRSQTSDEMTQFMWYESLETTGIFLNAASRECVMVQNDDDDDNDYNI